jgi:hypothetical protein
MGIITVVLLIVLKKMPMGNYLSNCRSNVTSCLATMMLIVYIIKRINSTLNSILKIVKTFLSIQNISHPLNNITNL